MNNSEFPKPAYRFDSYKNYRFRIKCDGKYVAGVSKVGGLARTTKVIVNRVGSKAGEPAQRMPGPADYGAIILERGVTYEAAFEQWANKVWDYQNTAREEQQGGTGNQDVSLKDFRKDIIIEGYNEAGQKVLAYHIYRCWPSEFQAVPEMDANGNAVAIQSLKLENEGWERDTSIEEPPEPSFTLPA